MDRTRPEAAHAPGVRRLAGCPLVGPLPPHAHAREVDARAAQITTAEGRTARKTTAAPAPVSSARRSTTPADGRWGSPLAEWQGRSAARSIRPSTSFPGNHRCTATDSRGVADTAAGPAGAAALAGDAGPGVAGPSPSRDRRTGHTAAARDRSAARAA